MIEKAVDLSAPVHELITSRWSGVSYDPKRPGSITTFAQWLAQRSLGTSCFGDQLVILFCDKHTNPDAWQKAFDCLAEGQPALVPARPGTEPDLCGYPLLKQ